MFGELNHSFNVAQIIAMQMESIILAAEDMTDVKMRVNHHGAPKSVDFHCRPMSFAVDGDNGCAGLLFIAKHRAIQQTKGPRFVCIYMDDEIVVVKGTRELVGSYLPNPNLDEYVQIDSENYVEAAEVALDHLLYVDEDQGE